MLKKSKFALFSLIITLLGCQGIDTSSFTENGKTTIKSVSSDLAPYTLKVWEDHLTQVKASGAIQKGCEPFYKLAEGKAIGSVVLFHGYTACPQQYEDLSRLLSQKGYNVFVPLLPGHGKQQIEVDGKITDDFSQLPEMDSTFIYDNFAKNMGDILRDETGTRVVSGLSLGGVIATKVMLHHQDIYDRALLMAPFFNAAAPINVLLPVAGAIMPNKKMSWGKVCEDKRQFSGRAGYCDFKIENVAAVRKFGLETLKQVSAIKKPVQIVGVEKDPAANNSDIAKAVDYIPHAQGCFLAKGATHSMLSREDNPSVEMFWLKPLLDQSVRYIDTGKNFDVVGDSEHDLGLCKSY